MVELEMSVMQAMDAYKEAVFAKDSDALMRLYDPKVRVFDAWGVWSYEGSDAWQRAVEAWLTSLGAERVTVSFDDTQVLIHGESAILSSIATFAGVSEHGETLRSMQNRLTWVLLRQGHELKIVHEHTSLPLGFEDMKGILQRSVTLP